MGGRKGEEMSTKALIEQFYSRYQNVVVVMTYPPDGPDMTGQCEESDRPYEHEACCEEICEELGFPWYPGRAVNCSTLEEQEADQKRCEEEFVLTLAELEAYLPEAEVAKTGEQFQAFREAAKQKYPRLHYCWSNGASLHKWVYRFAEVVEALPALLAIQSEAEQIKAYLAFIGQHADDHNGPGPIHIETLDQRDARKAEQKRKSLEQSAAIYAARMGCKVSSMDFIKGLHEQIERHQEARYGLREDGLCATAYPFSSVAGFEQWSEMDMDEQSSIADIRDILDWIQDNCPLLWCKWEEKQLETAGKEGNDQ